MIFSRLTKEDASVYLADRAAKGFTVIQAYMVPWQWYKGEEKNRYGHLPFFNNDMGRPNPAYFDHVEWVIEEAARHGLIMAVGPAELGAAYEYYDDEGAAAYGTYLADRFKRTSNIIWMLCGDADPNLRLSAVRAMAYAIRAIDQHLMTCHVFAPHSSRELIAKEDWLDFHMAQSYVWRDRIYPLVANDYGFGKPVGMSESTYERAVQAAEFGYSFPDASVVRNQAFWSMFAGGYFTYGADPLYNFRSGWRDLLQLEGARWLRAFRQFMLARQWWTYRPRQDIWVEGMGSGLSLNTAVYSREDDTMLLYFSRPSSATVRLDVLRASVGFAKWIDPISFSEHPAGRSSRENTIAVTTPKGWLDALLIIQGEGG
jgi:hypothetical protein